MPRTTEEQVGDIIEADATIGLSPFIEVANSLVTELCASVVPAYSAERLELIERWLSAHFYAIRDMRAANEKADVVGIAYQFKVGLYFENTMYGQQALLLDTAGGLARHQESIKKGKRKQVGIVWLGSSPEEYAEDI